MLGSVGDAYHYSGEHRVRIAGKGGEGFKKINVSVERQSKAMSGSKLEIVIKLTDNDDPFFLYTKQLTEEDYKTLKIKSGLLVDFDEFVHQIIGFLNDCRDEDHLETMQNRSKLLEFRTEEFNESEAVLRILEITRFKQSDLVALNLRIGDDDDVKKYLASCLKKMREEVYVMKKRIKETEEVNSHLSASLSEQKIEYEKLKTEKETITNQLVSKHQAELEREHETNKQIQFTMNKTHANEKDQLEKSYSKQIRELESRLSEISDESRILAENKKENEYRIGELTHHNQKMSEELGTTQNELARLRSHASTLESQVQRFQIELESKQQQTANLEKSLKEREERESVLNDKLRQSKSHIAKVEDSLNRKREELKRKDEELEKHRGELTIQIGINKDLNNMRHMFESKDENNKKLIGELTAMVKEKESEIAQLKSKADKRDKKIDSYTEQIAKLHKELDEKNSKIDQCELRLKKNDEMINFLNKRLLSESTSNATGNTNSNNSMPGNGFRPSGSLPSYNSGSNLLPMSNNTYMPSNPITSLTNAFDTNLALNINPTSMPVENQQNHEMISPNVGSRVAAANPTGNRLEAKYFSSHMTQQPMTTSSMMPGNMIKSNLASSSTTSASMNHQQATAAVRLNNNNKPFMTGMNGAATTATTTTGGSSSNYPSSTKSAASLTSAYFPMAN